MYQLIENPAINAAKFRKCGFTEYDDRISVETQTRAITMLIAIVFGFEKIGDLCISLTTEDSSLDKE